jgi:hypothetical protein
MKRFVEGEDRRQATLLSRHVFIDAARSSEAL